MNIERNSIEILYAKYRASGNSHPPGNDSVNADAAQSATLPGDFNDGWSDHPLSEVDQLYMQYQIRRTDRSNSINVILNAAQHRTAFERQGKSQRMSRESKKIIMNVAASQPRQSPVKQSKGNTLYLLTMPGRLLDKAFNVFATRKAARAVAIALPVVVVALVALIAIPDFGKTQSQHSNIATISNLKDNARALTGFINLGTDSDFAMSAQTSEQSSSYRLGILSTDFIVASEANDMTAIQSLARKTVRIAKIVGNTALADIATTTGNLASESSKNTQSSVSELLSTISEAAPDDFRFRIGTEIESVYLSANQALSGNSSSLEDSLNNLKRISNQATDQLTERELMLLKRVTPETSPGSSKQQIRKIINSFSTLKSQL